MSIVLSTKFWNGINTYLSNFKQCRLYNEQKVLMQAVFLDISCWYWKLLVKFTQDMIKNKKICSRCIYDEHIPNISFSDDGICNYCDQIDFLKKEFGTGKKKGHKLLKNLINKIKKEGQSKKYDCVIGVSGGTDS